MTIPGKLTLATGDTAPANPPVGRVSLCYLNNSLMLIDSAGVQHPVKLFNPQTDAQIVSPVPAAENDFSMFAGNAVPASGTFIAIELTKLWIIQAGWAAWKLSILNAPN